MRSIGEVLDGKRGLGGGFDFLRIALAFSVIAWHVPSVAGNDAQYSMHFLWLADYAILVLFFGLSGFLITGSAMRLSLRNFLINRGLRIFPALAVEVVLCALIIGPVFTTLPIREYFSSHLTYHYFTNIVALINYRLPAVFDNHVTTQVNGSLWTVPYEMACYAIMSVFIYFALLRKPWVSVAIAVVCVVLGLALVVLYPAGPPQTGIIALVSHTFYGRGSRLFVAFCLGIAAFLYRYRLPYSPVWFGIASGYILIVAGIGHGHAPHPVISALTAVPLTYIMAFLGVTELPRLPFFHRGDYSYGVYLYGWPAEQVILGLFPQLAPNIVVLLLATAALATAFAVLSWHLIEKPILRQRKKFSFVARQRLAEAGPDASLAGAINDRPLPPAGARPESISKMS